MGLIGHLLDPSSWDWGTVPDWIVVATAIAATLFGLRNLKQARDAQRAAAEAEQRSARVAEATLLLRVDAIYESAYMYRSRLAIRQLVDHAEVRVGNRGEAAVRRMVCRYLDLLRALARHGRSRRHPRHRWGQEAHRIYSTLMRLPNYIETIALLENEGQIHPNRVRDLYGVMIDQAIGFTIDHIRARQRANPDFLKLAVALHGKLAKHDAAARAG